MSDGHENVKWVDGLRGIASLLVVFTHVARAFNEDVFKPTSEEHATPRFLQYPIIRVLVQGRIGVSIFSLITGYVCALKPIRQCAAGNQDAAFRGIAKSAFRRIPKLLLPVSIATILIWLICQFGGFEVSSIAEGWWLKYSSPKITPHIGKAVKLLLLNMITTWTHSRNAYDDSHWTLLPQLKGAFLVYMMLLTTAYTKPRYRMVVEIGLFVYYYISSDSFGMQFFFGAFLSDLSQHAPHVAWMSTRKWPSRFLSPILVLIGLLLASYPEQKPEWMTWSKYMLQISTWIFPRTHEIPRFYTGLGLEFIALGIHFSNPVKKILSNKHLLWFGKNSFAVYLLHGTFIRTLLVWMLLGVKIPSDVITENELLGVKIPADVITENELHVRPKLKPCGRLRWYFWLPVWFVILYACASLWTNYVDPFCAWLTQKLEEYVFEEQNPQQKMLERGGSLRLFELCARNAPRSGDSLLVVGVLAAGQTEAFGKFMLDS